MGQTARDFWDWIGKTGKNIAGAVSGDNQRDLQEQQRQSAELAYQREQSSAREAMAYSSYEASLNRSFQQESAREAMDFSSSEAAKDRDWQQMMSNTSHQREMADLSAAGLNPILAATGGAPMGGGAQGQGYSASGAQGQGQSSSGHKAEVSTENQLFKVLNSAMGVLNAFSRVRSPANITNYYKK